MAKTEEQEWDRTTASIHSEDSDDLYEARPNRWRGARSTWRWYTRAERAVHEGLEAARAADLSVHLYDAYALRRGKRRKIGPRGELGDDYDDAEDRWVPPRSWTAWPLKWRDVPKDDFMPVQLLDEDSAFTYRRGERALPSSALAAEIEAHILRVAKDRLLARDMDEKEQSEGQERDGVSQAEVDDASDGDSEPPSQAEGSRRSRSRSASQVIKVEDSKMEVDHRDQSRGGNRAPGTPGIKRERRTDGAEMRGVPAADDEVSSAILRPAVGDIVGKLERTLKVLHNMMAATVRTKHDGIKEWEASGDEQLTTGLSIGSRPGSRRGGTAQKRPRKRHRSRSQAAQATGAEQSEITDNLSPLKKVKKFEPPDEHAMDADVEDSSETDTASSAPPSPVPIKHPSPAPEISALENPAVEAKERPVPLSERQLSRLHAHALAFAPRDWKAVLGAASLAGFPPAVLARATQRCATLFNEDVDLLTLHDHSPARDTALPVHPGGDLDLPSEDDDDALAELTRIRLLARENSRLDIKPEARTPRSATRSQTPARPARRASTPAPSRAGTPRSAGASPSSRSRSSTRLLVCPHRDCPRATEPFGRKSNLERHLERVHGGKGGVGEEVDSEDEMVGGVHVDGFLRPVTLRRGWRGDDVNIKGDGDRGRKRERR